MWKHTIVLACLHRQSLVKPVTIIFQTAKTLNKHDFNNQKNSHSVIQDSPKHQNECKENVCFNYSY